MFEFNKPKLEVIQGGKASAPSHTPYRTHARNLRKLGLSELEICQILGVRFFSGLVVKYRNSRRGITPPEVK